MNANRQQVVFLLETISPALNYQLFLTQQDHHKVLKELNYTGLQWTFHKTSVVHFYGGYYIWTTGYDFINDVKRILKINFIW
mgnify:CR=1